MMDKFDETLIDFSLYKGLLSVGVEETEAYKIAKESAEDELNFLLTENSLREFRDRADLSNQKLRSYVDISNQKAYSNINDAFISLQEYAANRHVTTLLKIRQKQILTMSLIVIQLAILTVIISSMLILVSSNS